MPEPRDPRESGNHNQQVTLHRDGLRLRFYTSIPSTRSAIGTVAERVREEVADRPGFADDDMTNLEIALREAIANAIIHGNENDPTKKVLVSCYMEPGHGVLIAIQDEGKGFDPGAVPDPREAERIHLHHGRGIFLMRQLMDHVEHRNGGREVILLKRPSGEHDLKKKKPPSDDEKD